MISCTLYAHVSLSKLHQNNIRDLFWYTFAGVPVGSKSIVDNLDSNEYGVPNAMVRNTRQGVAKSCLNKGMTFSISCEFFVLKLKIIFH